MILFIKKKKKTTSYKMKNLINFTDKFENSISGLILYEKSLENTYSNPSHSSHYFDSIHWPGDI
jgi:hypothetical protein